MANMKRNYIIATLASIVVAATAYLTLMHRGDRLHEVSINPGTELFSIDTAEIKTFNYETQSSHLQAIRREKGKNEFEIEISHKDGRLVERCQGGSAFLSTLNTFATIKAVRALADTNPVQYPLNLGAVLIGDNSSLEPAQWRFMASGDKAIVIGSDGMQFYVVNIPYSAFQTLLEGCSRLSA